MRFWSSKDPVVAPIRGGDVSECSSSSLLGLTFTGSHRVTRATHRRLRAIPHYCLQRAMHMGAPIQRLLHLLWTQA